MAETKKCTPKFKDLEVTTRTVMVYHNMTFNRKETFKNTHIYEVEDPPRTKKKKNIDKSKLEIPYGEICSMQYGVYVKGLRMSKATSNHCPWCQLYEEKNDDEGNAKPIMTVKQELRELTKKERKKEGFDSDVKKISFVCDRCNREIQPKQFKKPIPFLNQLTMVLSLGEININVMMFDTSIKTAGNKRRDDALEVMMLLWENHIRSNKTCWKFQNDKSKSTKFLFDPVMVNYKFTLNFAIDKDKFSKLFSQENMENVKLCKYEPTSSTNVNVKFVCHKPEGHRYDVLKYKKGGFGVVIREKCEKNKFNNKKEKDKTITLIVFPSAEVIMSGSYEKVSKKIYNQFIKTVNSHKDDIEEKVNVEKLDLSKFIDKVQ